MKFVNRRAPTLVSPNVRYGKENAESDISRQNQRIQCMHTAVNEDRCLVQDGMSIHEVNMRNGVASLLLTSKLHSFHRISVTYLIIYQINNKMKQ